MSARGHAALGVQLPLFVRLHGERAAHVCTRADRIRLPARCGRVRPSWECGSCGVQRHPRQWCGAVPPLFRFFVGSWPDKLATELSKRALGGVSEQHPCRPNSFEGLTLAGCSG